MKNLRIFLLFVLSTLLLSSCASSTPQAIIPPDECFTVEGNTIKEYDLQNEKCPTSIIIPDAIGGVKITEIGEEAFLKWTYTDGPIKETSYSYKYKLKKQGCFHYENASEECYQIYLDMKKALGIRLITNVVIGDNIQEIGDEAFTFNDIKSVTFGKGIRKIVRSAFRFNEIGIVDFGRAENSIEIGKNAFGYNKIDMITLPSKSIIDESSFDKNVIISFK